MTNQLFNRPSNKTQRTHLRRNQTYAEQRLWQHLRQQQLGAKFRRQHGIGNYIADFYCPAWKLVIEVDGDTHYTEEAQQHDQVRTRYMQRLGMTVLRFTNQEVMQNIEGVLGCILQQRVADVTPT